MKLTDLEAKFLRHCPDGSSDLSEEGPQEADGLMLLCPKCFEANKGNVGTHSIICWFTDRVPDDLAPKPGRWNPQGSGLDDLTFVGPGAVSVLLTLGCQAHFFIRNGKIEW